MKQPRVCQVFVAAALLGALLSPGLLSAETGLFDSDEPLEISLAVHFKDLCRPREDEDCDYSPTALTFSSESQGSGELPVEVIVRGGWRAMESRCTAPLLFVRFDESTTAGTPFAGQKVLPLTTHCGQGLSIDSVRNRINPGQYEQYLLMEYLAYRMYQLVSDTSLKVRLVKIRYADPDKPSNVIRSSAFFTEHFDSLAARTGTRVMERWTFDHELLDTRAADRLAMFQYMIGNTDWSIARQRNILLLQSMDNVQVAVPFDLDMSGLVNAHYAGPPPTLPISKVTQRYYLGYCHPDADWDGLYESFLDLEPSVFELLDSLEGLNRGSHRRAEYFLARFFDTLHSEKDCEARIADSCQAWPPTADDHMNVEGK